MSNTDGISLVTNDIRKLFIERGIDPMGATEFEQGVYMAIDIIARAIQDGDIAAYANPVEYELKAKETA